MSEGDDMTAIEGEVVEKNGATVLAVRETTSIQEWTPRFAISVDQAVEIVKQKRDFMQRVMHDGAHYGVIPGTDKPALLKPGAELLLSSMGLRPELVDAAAPIEDWTGEQHGGEPFLQYRRACIIWRQTGPGTEDRVFIARAEGSCSSWEKKYRYRNAARVCPECGESQIIKGKAEFGGGWLCWKKKGGCGEKFAEDDARITKQEIGQVANKDVADLANTILKMADKRAMVAATLVATGCSDIFTQDLEDSVDDVGEPEPQRPAPKQAAKPPARKAQGSEKRQEVTTPSQGSTDRDSPAATAETPASSGPVGTGEIGDMEKLYWLGETLPRDAQTKAQIEHLVKMHGYQKILGRLVTAHKLRCGSTCEHVESIEVPF